ncbi:LysR family transcriptional regulator [Periweissella cryptocerci]|nr:LysR family transcriptional regulator [Periweissella cryptocerci]
MNTQKLTFFLNAAATLNYSETAEQMYTTQGNVSKQILALEAELGVQLFTRVHRELQLTTAGEALLIHARQVLDAVNELEVAMGDFGAAKAMRLTISTLPSIAVYQGLDIIGQFHRQHPEITLQVQDEESAVILNALDTGKSDIIFARCFEADAKYEKIVTEVDQLVVVLPKTHPLATAKQIQLQDLSQETFLQLGRETQLLQRVRELCQAAGFEPQIGYEGTRLEIIMDLVRKQMGISLMMEKAALATQNDAVVIRPLVTTPTSELAFLRKKGQHSTVNNQFWQFLQSMV